MRDFVGIGMGRSARRGLRLDQVAVVPSRRTRDVDDVSLAWQIDAFSFEIPMLAHPSDATVSPATAVRIGQLGGLAALNAEGLWTRYDDPTPQLAAIAEAEPEGRTALLQKLYGAPVQPELISKRISEMREAGAPVVAVRVSPQHTESYAPIAVAAGVDLLVIQGTLVSAEHVSSKGEVLNLKQFIADLDVPVVVGGCVNYQTALHLMRTGAAGVIVGMGADAWATSDEVLGIDVPMATAIADAAAARRDYLDETGGRYVHVIADGAIATSGDIARAIACGADAVMLGAPLAAMSEAPARGTWWHVAASHPKLPRGAVAEVLIDDDVDLQTLLFGPATAPYGDANLFGALARAMGKSGYQNLKEFQKVDLIVTA